MGTRFKAEHNILQEPYTGSDLIPAGVLLVTPDLGKARTGVTRPDEELNETLELVGAESLEDACRNLDVRIQGTISDVDGESIAVDIPVRNERAFTPDGLTRLDPTLRKLYLTSKVADTAARFFEKSGGITEEQVQALETLAETLRRSLPGDEVIER